MKMFMAMPLTPMIPRLTRFQRAGTRVTPGMVLQMDWLTLGVSYLVLAIVTAGTVAWLVWFTAKMQLHQVLRIGEG